MDTLQFDGPVVLAIMDGIGLSSKQEGNALARARTPFLGWASAVFPHIAINASGEAVGLMPGQMGNSEVGHQTMGCGQIYKQGLAHIEEAFEDGSIWNSEAWMSAIKNVVSNDSTLHFVGILSDGGVHSHIKHLEKMVARAYMEGVRKIRLHAVLDGRDVPPQSAEKYIEEIEKFFTKFDYADFEIASGGGRMITVADRYENDWQVVERGFNMMVKGVADNYVFSAADAIERFRRDDPEIQDQNLPTFVVVDDSDRPVGIVKEGDSVINFDFRADRAIEITRAFTEPDFAPFNRGNFKPENIYFAALTEYDQTKHLPENCLVPPFKITNTLNQFLGGRGISQLAVSETLKFGHVTFYFNGNSRETAEGEDSIEIPSGTEEPVTRPWMKAAEITDTVIKNLRNYKFIRLNYPNGDMVGHSADLEAATIAVEAVDFELNRLYKEVEELGGVLIVVADHGNAEELLDENGEAKTAHTTNVVPFIVCSDKVQINQVEKPGLANLAATVAVLLGETDYPDAWQPPLVRA